MGLADKILALRRSGGLSTDAAATLLGVTRAQAEAELRDPSLADPAPAGGGGGGGGGGVALAPNGAFGDPTQEPAFLGWFSDPNEFYNLNGGDTSIYVDGCWAITESDPPGQPVIWVLDNAVAGWFVQATFTYDNIVAMAKAAVVLPPTFKDFHFAGPLTIGQVGQTRRWKPPFAGKIMGARADAASASDGKIEIDVKINGVTIFDPTNDAGDFIEVWAGQAVSNYLTLGPDYHRANAGNFAGGALITVEVAVNGAINTPLKDLTVSLEYVKS